MSGTAEIHTEATLSPSKIELVKAWLPSQSWFIGDASDAEIVGAYRFVDPYGEVGIETLLVRSGGVTYQVPLTYRAEALADAADSLVGTMEHSVLGTRYCYDAPADPVYVSELIRVIREGDTEADRSSGEKTAWVEGSGVVPVADLMGHARIARALTDDAQLASERARGILTARWNENGVQREETAACLK